MGLAISQNIVERHGGQIEVKSTVGQGTTFKILLPIDNRVPDITERDRAAAEAR